MKYVLLVYQSKQWAGLSEAEQHRVHDECTAWHQELEKSGHSRGATCLLDPSTPTRVGRSKDGPIVTDGPYAETREVLGGFEMVECRDLDEAMAIAKRFPALRVGCSMEVRQVQTDKEAEGDPP